MKTAFLWQLFFLEPIHTMSNCWKIPWIILWCCVQNRIKNTGGGEKVQSRGYAPHIRPCGEEKKELECSPDFWARWWDVEVTHSFFNHFRKFLVRYEKKAANYLALVQFAYVPIVWRKFLRIHC